MDTATLRGCLALLRRAERDGWRAVHDAINRLVPVIALRLLPEAEIKALHRACDAAALATLAGAPRWP